MIPLNPHRLHPVALRGQSLVRRHNPRQGPIVGQHRQLPISDNLYRVYSCHHRGISLYQAKLSQHTQFQIGEARSLTRAPAVT